MGLTERTYRARLIAAGLLVPADRERQEAREVATKLRALLDPLLAPFWKRERALLIDGEGLLAASAAIDAAEFARWNEVPLPPHLDDTEALQKGYGHLNRGKVAEVVITRWYVPAARGRRGIMYEDRRTIKG